LSAIIDQPTQGSPRGPARWVIPAVIGLVILSFLALPPVLNQRQAGAHEEWVLRTAHQIALEARIDHAGIAPTKDFPAPSAFLDDSILQRPAGTDHLTLEPASINPAATGDDPAFALRDPLRGIYWSFDVNGRLIERREQAASAP
jgi:hypothetical protein